MEETKSVEILLVTLDGELPSWLSDTPIVNRYNWSAYLKPIPTELLSLSLPEGRETEGIVIVDFGCAETRRAHCNSALIPSWLESNFLWREGDKDRVQRFPFIALYDFEKDAGLPHDLRENGIDFFLELAREPHNWKKANDLSEVIEYAWSQWQSPEWVQQYRQLALVSSTKRVVAVIRSDSKHDKEIWNQVSNHVSKPLAEAGYELCNVICDTFGLSSGKSVASDNVNQSDMIITQMSSDLLNSPLWGDVWRILCRRIADPVRKTGIHWFWSQDILSITIPSELKKIRPLWLPKGINPRELDNYPTLPISRNKREMTIQIASEILGQCRLPPRIKSGN